MATLAPVRARTAIARFRTTERRLEQPWSKRMSLVYVETAIGAIARSSRMAERDRPWQPAASVRPGGAVSPEQRMPYCVDSVMTVNETRDTIMPCAARKSDARRQTFEASQPEQFE